MAQLDEKSNLGLRCPRADVVRVVDALLLVSLAPTLLSWVFDACMKTSRNDVIARVLFSGKDKYYICALLLRSKFNICRLLHSLNLFCKQFKNISFMTAR